MTVTLPARVRPESTTSSEGPQVDLLQPDDDWAALWEAWLKALAGSPEAFVARHADEAELSPLQRRARLRGTTWVAARDAGCIVGIAELAEGSGPGENGMYYIQCVWVDEGYRKNGVLRKMLERLDIEARRRGIDELYLWVLATNPDAEKAYDKLKFSPGGKEQPSEKWGEGKYVLETLMVRPVF